MNTEAARIIKQGGVIAYPTESCFGLGCDPGNTRAIRRILHIKRRSRLKGLILVADHFSRFQPYLKEIPEQTRQLIMQTWPGPNTWLLSAKPNVSVWLKGEHSSLAVRVSRHRGIRSLCQTMGMAIVSTSANRAGRPPIRSLPDIIREFGGEVDYIVKGTLGMDKTPSIIRDAVTGKIIRP